MKKYIAYMLVSICYTACGMDMPQQELWIKANDKSMSMDRDIACRSNLLAALHTQYKGTRTDPLIIPKKARITKTTLCLFSYYHSKDAKSFIEAHGYNAALRITDKMKDAVSYAQLLEALAMPAEVTKRFTQLAADVALRSAFVKKLLTNTTIIDQCQRIGYETPSLKMSHDGYHFAHNIHFDDCPLRLWQTKKKPAEIPTIHSNLDLKYAIHFSCNGRYCIARGIQDPFVYDMATRMQYPLTLPTNIDTIRKIHISPDNKHIMISGIEGNGEERRYALWSFDEYNMPQPIPLTSQNWNNDVAYAIFHPDNKRLICNLYEKKLSLCPLATPNELTYNVSTDDDNLFIPRKLVTTADGNYVLAKRCGHENCPDALFPLHENIEMLPITIPGQSQQQKPWVKNRYIPHKQLLTHITHGGTMLQLLNTNMKTIAHHSTKNGAQIRALAVEPTGDYIASGYSDGTVIIWDLTTINNRIIGTKIRVPGGPIRSLIFGANQLLLCQTGKKIYDNFSHIEPQKSSALLCDVNGNIIIDFGLTIASIMSKKGNRIVTISEELQPIFVEPNSLESIVTAKVWYLHNKKVQQKLEERINLKLEECKTLSKLFKDISYMNR